MSKSIVDNPEMWSTPEDVTRREREMREGVNAYRVQRMQDRQRVQEVTKAILTPEPAKPEPGFAERYALHLDTTTGETFLTPSPNGEVRLDRHGKEGLVTIEWTHWEPVPLPPIEIFEG